MSERQEETRHRGAPNGREGAAPVIPEERNPDPLGKSPDSGPLRDDDAAIHLEIV
ncbi:MAG: hypothetical protein AB9873_05230 [Syntrophobacteraceae bacterium]